MSRTERQVCTKDGFWSKVDKRGPDECWPWLGKRRNGKLDYGMFGRVASHRYSYLINIGPIPSGLCVLHKCDNPPCVNPNHLWLGTRVDNNADKLNKGRQPHGEGNHSRLRAADIPVIIKRLRTETLASVSSDYGVSISTLQSIREGRKWKHIACERETVRKKIKLSENDVVNILECLKDPDLETNYIAKFFNVNPSVISNIKAGRLWKHVPRSINGPQT